MLFLNSIGDTFIIEKIIKLTESEFMVFSERLLDNYELIKENIDLMFIDNDNIWHVIMIKLIMDC